MHFIDDIHLISSLCRTVGYLFPDLTDIVYTVVGSRIDFNDVHGNTGCNIFTHGTFPAGTSVYRMFTVDCFCKNLRYSSLSGSSCATEQICMSNSICLYLILQCCYNMIWSFTSSNSAGRNLRYRAVYDMLNYSFTHHQN